jgi:hypothetical protein
LPLALIQPGAKKYPVNREFIELYQLKFLNNNKHPDMAELKTKQTDASVTDFINSFADLNKSAKDSLSF